MTKKTHDADVSFIQSLAELLRENDLTELEVMREYGDNDSLNVRVSRATPAAAQTVYAAAPAAAPGPVAAAAPAPSDSPAEVADPAAHPGAVPSPMVGTVYLQPEPGAPAFVSVGAQVAEGDTLLIIEAMKTMNHIPAPRAGTVKRILVEDGGAVEYGSPLLIIE
jgi:acetyl-CoA carboxylase biotin carboxyl carrier protein